MENRILNRYSKLRPIEQGRSETPSPSAQPSRKPPAQTEALPSNAKAADENVAGDETPGNLIRNIHRPIHNIFTVRHYFFSLALSVLTVLIFLLITRLYGFTIYNLGAVVHSIFNEPQKLFSIWALLFAALWIVHAVFLFVDHKSTSYERVYGAPNFGAQLVLTGFIDFASSLFIFGVIYFLWL